MLTELNTSCFGRKKSNLLVGKCPLFIFYKIHLSDSSVYANFIENRQREPWPKTICHIPDKKQTFQCRQLEPHKRLCQKVYRVQGHAFLKIHMPSLLSQFRSCQKVQKVFIDSHPTNTLSVCPKQPGDKEVKKWCCHFDTKKLKIFHLLFLMLNKKYNRKNAHNYNQANYAI